MRFPRSRLLVLTAGLLTFTAGLVQAQPNRLRQPPSISERLAVRAAAELDAAAPTEVKPAVISDTATPPGSEPPARLADGPAAAVKPAAEEPEPSPPKEASPGASEPLKPIPNAQNGVAALEQASFNGVTPGVTTMSEVEKAWGAPKEVRKVKGALCQWYIVEPFKRVELSYSGDKVSAVVIRMAQTFPADDVAKQLQFEGVRPVLVSNEVGEILGQAYPERGVLFAFAPSESGKPSMNVTQIIFEPIAAEPFVLRAETTIGTQPRLSRHDLEQAIKLDPKNARAQWLLARVLSAAGEYETAVRAASEAISLDGENPHYRVVRAQAFAQLGRLSDAASDAQRAAELAKTRPHVRARALCLQGDLAASGRKPDLAKAVRLHSEAVKLADSLVKDKHPAVRRAAKEVLVDAHLGAAHDIAWGDWKDRETAVPQWLSRAAAAAEDLITKENAGEDLRLRVAVRALAACVGMRGELDPTPWAKQVLEQGETRLQATPDAIRQAQLQWDLGMALYDALQAYQIRGEHENALKYGEQAIAYLEKVDPQRRTAASDYLLGRLYFRIGAVHALRGQKHKEAVVWFDKAAPLLDRPLPVDARGEIGHHGETFVSMGVSFWESGEQDKAIDLTAKGITLMEEAVKLGLMERSALAIPYTNLAAMHGDRGQKEEAGRYQRMATQSKQSKLK